MTPTRWYTLAVIPILCGIWLLGTAIHYAFQPECDGFVLIAILVASLIALAGGAFGITEGKLLEESE